MIKRLLDVILSLAALVILSPVLAAIGILVRLSLGSPIFFRQQRPGLHGRPFLLLKFRTMTDARDAQGNPLPDDERQMFKRIISAYREIGSAKGLHGTNL